MDKITLEKCYEIYHREKMFCQKGIYPKKIKNWDPIMARPTWMYFIKLSDMLYRSAGKIDPNTYIKSIVNHFSKSIHPKLLINPKGIKAYRNKIKEDYYNANDIKKIGSIKNSIVFVVKYCINNNIKSFRDYFHLKSNIYPTLVLHYESNKLSKFFMFSIPNLKDRVESYPADIKYDIFNDNFWSECSTFQIESNNDKTLKKLKLNLEQIINKLIENDKN